ncbi:hypothetical protein OAC89_02120 [Deltaproteobacteria bacterium]|nr:hypothetical protein [Deltaproteobacteria bacterium]
MKYFYIFLSRLILSVGMASIISVFFFNGIHSIKTPLLAGVMLVLAYMFEYTKKREDGEG